MKLVFECHVSSKKIWPCRFVSPQFSKDILILFFTQDIKKSYFYLRREWSKSTFSVLHYSLTTPHKLIGTFLTSIIASLHRKWNRNKLYHQKLNLQSPFQVTWHLKNYDLRKQRNLRKTVKLSGISYYKFH